MPLLERQPLETEVDLRNRTNQPLETGISLFDVAKWLLQAPGRALQAVFDGDAGLGQRIANLIGLGKVPSLAGFGTGIELFG